MPKVKGFTLLELLITLAVLAIVLGLGLPAMAEWRRQAQATALRHTLVHALQYSRKQAVHLQTTITLCPGQNDCQDDWGEHILVFTDPNRNGVLDSDEQLLKAISLGDAGKQLTWNRSHSQLRFSRQGISGLSGTLAYCTKSHQNFGIVISRVGRLRLTDEVDCS